MGAFVCPWESIEADAEVYFQYVGYILEMKYIRQPCRYHPHSLRSKLRRIPCGIPPRLHPRPSLMSTLCALPSLSRSSLSPSPPPPSVPRAAAVGMRRCRAGFLHFAVTALVWVSFGSVGQFQYLVLGAADTPEQVCALLDQRIDTRCVFCVASDDVCVMV